MKPFDYVVPAGAVPLDQVYSPTDAASIEFQRKQRALLQFGSQSSSYFNLQEGVRTLTLDGVGFVTYFPQATGFGCVNIVFTNPVCDPARLPLLLRHFFQTVPGRKLFFGVDETTARALQAEGYRMNQMGTEFSIPLNEFEVAGKQKKQLRHAANLGVRHGLVVKEQPWAAIDAAEVRGISDAWRSQKAVSGRELRLLTRPPVFSEEWGVRKFYCYQDQRLIGYVFFDPFFREGQLIGYTANILRTWPGIRPSGVLDHILLEAIKQFQSEGVSNLSLGIAPLHGIEPVPGDRASVRTVSNWLYRNANSLYAFQALAYHKSRYRGVETPWYLCSDDISIGKTVIALLLGTRLLWK